MRSFVIHLSKYKLCSALTYTYKALTIIIIIDYNISVIVKIIKKYLLFLNRYFKNVVYS